MAETLRVLPRCGLPGLRALRWADVPADHPQLAGWLEAGLVARVGLRGEAPPERLAPPRCCGGA